MVSYQRFVSIVFETAREKGASFDGIEDSQPVMSVSADIWQERKSELQSASVQKARQVADEEVTVR